MDWAADNAEKENTVKPQFLLQNGCFWFMATEKQ
jgi:hypothetical protein